MFAQERHDEILLILKNMGKVVVKDLSLKFNVTDDCIRKDLKLLEGKNLLERTYGGAVPMRKSAHEEKINLRKNSNLKLKSIIASKAFDLIEAGETIFLDISTTNILLAHLIAEGNKKITVITNMLDIMVVLNEGTNCVKVISPGGVLCKDLNGYTGSMTIESISNYKITRSFIGSCGVNLMDKSITTFDVEDGNTKKAIIKNTKTTYLVMDSSKFYFDGSYKFATLQNINAIITEACPSKDISDLLNKIDIALI